MLLPGSLESYRSPSRSASVQPREERRIGHLLALRHASGTVTPGLLARARIGLRALVAPAPTFTPGLDCCTA